MASIATLREHLVEELNDLLNAEQQLIIALPKLAQKASQRELKSAFRSHLAETKGHVKRATEAHLSFLGQVFGFEPADKLEPIQIENLEVAPH